MKLLLTSVFIGISASSIAMNSFFGDVELKDMSNRITATDWITLVEQIRRQSMTNQPLADELINKFKREVDKENNFIEFPKKAAEFNFMAIGVDLADYERDQLKKTIQTFIMHSAFEKAQKEVNRMNNWKNDQSDSYKLLWSQLAGNVTAPAAE